MLSHSSSEAVHSNNFDQTKIGLIEKTARELIAGKYSVQDLNRFFKMEECAIPELALTLMKLQQPALVQQVIESFSASLDPNIPVGNEISLAFCAASLKQWDVLIALHQYTKPINLDVGCLIKIDTEDGILQYTKTVASLISQENKWDILSRVYPKHKKINFNAAFEENIGNLRYLCTNGFKFITTLPLYFQLDFFPSFPINDVKFQPLASHVIDYNASIYGKVNGFEFDGNQLQFILTNDTSMPKIQTRISTFAQLISQGKWNVLHFMIHNARPQAVDLSARIDQFSVLEYLFQKQAPLELICEIILIANLSGWKEFDFNFKPFQQEQFNLLTHLLGSDQKQRCKYYWIKKFLPYQKSELHWPETMSTESMFRDWISNKIDTEFYFSYIDSHLKRIKSVIPLFYSQKDVFNLKNICFDEDMMKYVDWEDRLKLIVKVLTAHFQLGYTDHILLNISCEHIGHTVFFRLIDSQNWALIGRMVRQHKDIIELDGGPKRRREICVTRSASDKIVNKPNCEYGITVLRKLFKKSAPFELLHLIFVKNIQNGMTQEILKNMHPGLEWLFEYASISARNGLNNKPFSLHKTGRAPFFFNPRIDTKSNFLYIATWGNLPSLRKLLKKSKIDINKSNEYGYTALQLAIENRNIETACFLLWGKADLSKENQFGRTPMNSALEKYIIPVLNFMRTIICFNYCTNDLDEALYQAISQRDENAIKIIEMGNGQSQNHTYSQ